MTSKAQQGPSRIRVTHVINSLGHGGAESMLSNLLQRTDRDRFDPSVVMLIDDVTLADPVRKASIPIASMGMRAGVPDPRGLARLARHLKRERPHVVQTWMDHSNLIGGVAARAGLGSAVRVVWGVHHSNHVPGLTKRTTLWTLSACARLSTRVPDTIVLVSEAARALYASRGFSSDRMEVVPNGFNTEVFQPDPEARFWLRGQLNLSPDTPLVGLVARYDPNKDHANFLRAAAQVAEVFPDVHFVLCGDKVTCENPVLAGHLEALGLTSRCHLLGSRRDVARIHAAIDIAISSSLSEAFPLAIGEAMACGTPCVATHVGDSALIVGPCGRIVPPRDSRSLALGIAELLTLDPNDRRRLGVAARKRICEMFDLTAITRRYESIYRRLHDQRGSAAPGLVDGEPARKEGSAPAQVSRVTP